jgi:hypothetical protein
MSNHEPALGEALRLWKVEGAPRDWEDVLQRAGHEEEPRRYFGRPALIVATALIAVLIAAPASGLVSSVASLFERDRGVELVADLSGPEDGAKLEVLAPGAFVTVVGDTAGPRFRSREEGRIRFRRAGTLQWRLRGAGTSVQEVRVVFSGAPSLAAQTLCGPCSPNPSGAFAVTQAEAAGIFNGRASAEVLTATGRRHGVLSLRRTGQ